MPTWTTKSGTKIKVEDMTDNHILYALRLCMRSQMRVIQMYFDEELGQLLNLATQRYLYSWISIFDKEIIKRGLTPLPIEELQQLKVNTIKSLPDNTILNLETEST